MNSNEILLGYEIGTGKEVSLSFHHTVVTGMTQLSGKTTALEALVERSKARAVAFLTKRGESGFQGQREIPPYFKEQKKGSLIDWQYVSAILEATMSEKMKFERSWIIKVCKGARSLQQVYQNIKSAQADARRSLDESIYTVTPDTPLVVRDQKTGLIDVIPISDIKARMNLPFGKKEIITPIEGLEVYGRSGFSPIRAISKHGLPVHRMVNCPGGYVKCSEAHSLFNSEGGLLAGKEVIKGSKLELVDLPKIPETIFVHPEVAWLYGLFAAEGTAGNWDTSEINQAKKGKRGQFCYISNTDRSLLERAGKIYTRHFGFSYAIHPANGRCFHLVLHGPSGRQGVNYIPKKFNALFYTSYRGHSKKVPRLILNAGQVAKKEFLRGYNAGDGAHNLGNKYEFQRFGTISPTLAQGLYLLANEVLAQRLNVHVREDGYITIFLNSPNNYHGRNLCRAPDNVVKQVRTFKINRGMGYDIQTGDETFLAGVGRILTHNTNLAAYFEIILPEMEKYAFSESLSLRPGFNVLNLVGMADEMQQLVIESVIGYVLKNLNNTVVIIPEAHKFIPEGRNTPVKATALRMIREGAAVGDYLWIDTQETTSVSKALLKQCSNWIMGYQQEKNEVSNVRDNLGKRNITEEQIMNLKIGHFMVSLQQKFYHVYVLPSGIDPEMGRKVALGEIDVDEVRGILNGRKKPVTDAIARSFKLIEEDKMIIPDASKFVEGEDSSLGPGLFDKPSQMGMMTEINERLTKTLEALDRAEIRTNELDDEVDMRMADIATMQKIIEVKNTHIDELHAEIYWLNEDLSVYESFKLQLVDFILPSLKRANIFQSVPDTGGKTVKMITEQEIESLIDKKLNKIGRPKIIAATQDSTSFPWINIWLPKLDGMQQKIIRKMAEKFPLTLTKSDISLSTGYSPRGGSFNDALSKLVKWKLLVKDGEKYKLAQGPPE